MCVHRIQRSSQTQLYTRKYTVTPISSQPLTSLTSSFSDCPVPFFLQHLWNLAVVPNPIHSTAHPSGQRPGQHLCQVPLVCSLLSHLFLLPDPADCVWPVSGRLASAGGCGCPHHPGAAPDCAAPAAAVPLPSVPAPEASRLEFPALVDALSETLGQRHLPGHYLLPETLLLLLPGVLPSVLHGVWLQVLPLQQVLQEHGGSGRGAGCPSQGLCGL